MQDARTHLKNLYPAMSTLSLLSRLLSSLIDLTLPTFSPSYPPSFPPSLFASHPPSVLLSLPPFLSPFRSSPCSTFLLRLFLPLSPKSRSRSRGENTASGRRESQWSVDEWVHPALHGSAGKPRRCCSGELRATFSNELTVRNALWFAL